jgi:hypothetical protein
MAPSDGLPRVSIRSLSEAQRTCPELVERIDPMLLTRCGSRASYLAVMHNAAVHGRGALALVEG